MYGFLIALGLLNMYAFWLIPWIELIAGLLHVILWIVYAVVLLTLAPRHSTRFVFLEKANASGWTSDFVSFNLGIILLSWGFVGYDAMAHISEVGVFSFFRETFFFHGSIHHMLHVYISLSIYHTNTDMVQLLIQHCLHFIGNEKSPVHHPPSHVLVHLRQRRHGVWDDHHPPLLRR